jgi:aminoglycoside phosphotransferase (APT) family kinase protein
MPAPWTPDLCITADLAVEVIGRQFPELSPVSALPLGAGWDNTVFRVSERYVFRFPRRKIAVPLLQAEVRLLPWLAGRLPLAVPPVRFLGRPEERFPWPFAGYLLLPGTTACSLDLADAQRGALAAPLARFLRALHGLDPAAAEALGAGPDTIGRLDTGRRVPPCHGYLDRLRAAGHLDDATAGRLHAITAASAGLAPDDRRAVVHGDLYVRHLLIGDAGDLVGVIDWGDVHLGHPAVDLGVVHSFLPPEAHAAFRQHYGPIDDLTWALARFRALYHSAVLAVYGQDIGDADLIREGVRALKYIAR